jgi:hypothetical protein
MHCTIEMDSGGMIYIPSIMKIGSAIQKLIRGNMHTHRQEGDLIRLFLFFEKQGK